MHRPRDGGLGLVGEAAQIAPAHIRLDDEPPLGCFAADELGFVSELDFGDIAKGHESSGSRAQ